MKRKNAFTLIELLAIIVILAIIAVITVPIILGIIDDASKNASIDSAYGFNDSMSKGYLINLMSDSNSELPSGTFVMRDNGVMTDKDSNIIVTNVSGNVPEEGSWVKVEKGKIVAYSLKFGDYVVTKYEDTEVQAVKNGTIADDPEVREALLEAERQNNAKATALTLIPTVSEGYIGIEDITEGWFAFINGEVIGYSVAVTEDTYTYIVTNHNGTITASRVKTEVDLKSIVEQDVVSAKVDSYVKAALASNSSLTDETAKTVSEMSSVTTNQADSGWIHFNVESNTVSVIDYSLTYGTLTANYSSLTGGNYVSTFGAARNKPVVIAVGSDVCLRETDCFKVIEINGTTATLLANNNIDLSTGYQGSDGTSYTIKFSQINYWMDTTTTPKTLKSNYSNNGAYTYDSGNYRFVDTNNTQVYPDIYESENYSGNPGTNTYSVAYYVNDYVTKLKALGINVISGRILKYSEILSGGIAVSYKISGENYWLGSITNIDGVWYVYSSGYTSTTPYMYSNGIRPVIYISIYDIP